MVTVVTCPTCSAKVEWKEENKFRPFCSLRCKQIDLGAWAEEKYVVPGAPPGEVDNENEGGDAPEQ
jgi:endogenous inhibitor of DNA gyrase (YacG/DUF329 family)